MGIVNKGRKEEEKKEKIGMVMEGEGDDGGEGKEKSTGLERE